jgi:hypothetical protein
MTAPVRCQNRTSVLSDTLGGDGPVDAQVSAEVGRAFAFTTIQNSRAMIVALPTDFRAPAAAR